LGADGLSVPPFNFGATFQFVTHVQSEIWWLLGRL